MTTARLDLADLSDALTWVVKAVPTRPSVPVLGGVRVTFSEQRITLAAFDYDTSHTAHVDAKVTETGEVLVPGRSAAAMIAALRGREVDLSPGGTGWGLTVKAGRSTFRLPELPLADFPKLPDPSPTVGVIDARLLDSMTRSVLWAAGRDDMLPVLTGVHLVGDQEALAMATTNRFVMAHRRALWGHKADVDALVSGRVLRAAVAGLHGRVEIGHDARSVRLTTKTREVTTRLLEGEFPRLGNFLTDPADAPLVVEVDVAELVDALDRATLALEANTSAVVAIRSDCVDVQASSQPAGGLDEPVDAVVTTRPDGELLDVAFNPVFLADALKALGTTRAVLGFTQAARPVSIRPAPTGNPDQDPDVHAVVMPRKRDR